MLVEVSWSLSLSSVDTGGGSGVAVVTWSMLVEVGSLSLSIDGDGGHSGSCGGVINPGDGVVVALSMLVVGGEGLSLSSWVVVHR